MQKYYAHYDSETKELIGFEKKEPFIELTKEEWQEALANGYNFVYYKKLIFRDLSSEDEKNKAYNETIFQELKEIDSKKTRALTDFVLTGDKSRLEELENLAQILRAKLK